MRLEEFDKTRYRSFDKRLWAARISLNIGKGKFYLLMAGEFLAETLNYFMRWREDISMLQ